MTVESGHIQIKTRGDCDIIDITQAVSDTIQNSKIKNGIATVFISGSTAGITTIEYETGLIHDLQSAWDMMIPRTITYAHDKKWGDGNGHAHVRASILGPCLTVPFNQKNMELGTWQQIIVVDFDNRPRNRDIIVQMMGE